MLGLVCSFWPLTYSGVLSSYDGFSPIFYSKHESGYSTVLTHAHWERYYLTTGYRLFSQHLGGTGKCRFGSVPLCNFHRSCLFFLTSHLFPTTPPPPSISRFMFYYPCSPFYDGFSPIFYSKHESGYSTLPCNGCRILTFTSRHPQYNFGIVCIEIVLFFFFNFISLQIALVLFFFKLANSIKQRK